MHATNALRANLQEDDQDVKSDISDVGGYTKQKRHKKHGPIVGTPASYTPYQDALYYSGNNKADYHPSSRKSVDYSHRRERDWEIHPDERVIEERWRRRRRYADGREEVEEGRDDPWDPESNQRLDGVGRESISEDELRRRRVEGWSEGVPESRDYRRGRNRDGFPLHMPIRERRGRDMEMEEYDERAPRRRRSTRHRREYAEEQDERAGYDTHDDYGRRIPSSSNPRSRHRRSSRSRSLSRSRSRSRSKSRRRNVPPHEDPEKPSESYTLLKAAKAAAWVGAVEAWRCRKEDGPWTGQKGRRVLIASGVGVAIGALRNGRLMDAGKRPYADAAMTGFYGIDFLKRVARHTEHGKGALMEQRNWREEREGRAPWQIKEREEGRSGR